MKKLNYFLSAVILLAVVATVGCGSDDDTGGGKTAEEQLLAKFGKKWTLTSATLDGKALPSANSMDGFVITLATGKSYTTNASSRTRKPNPWKDSGTFKFVGTITSATASSFSITREDGLAIKVNRTDTTLKLTFTFDSAKHKGTNGKIEAVNGAWVMNFKG